MRRATRGAGGVALVGIMAATIECGKLALSFLPNVEVVTLLCALYGYVFGWLGVLAAIVFVCIEPLIYGFGAWIISYFIYWPLVALVFMALGRARVENRLALTVFAVLLTILFGILSSLVDITVLSGSFDNFLYRFGVYYARGAVFYAVQAACNLVLFLLAFTPLQQLLRKIAGKQS